MNMVPYGPGRQPQVCAYHLIFANIVLQDRDTGCQDMRSLRRKTGSCTHILALIRSQPKLFGFSTPPTSLEAPFNGVAESPHTGISPALSHPRYVFKGSVGADIFRLDFGLLPRTTFKLWPTWQS